MYRIRKPGMSQPVGARRLNWQECTGHFVLALGPTLKPVHSVLYAPLQRLVVTGLKVQAIHPFQRAPVAAVSHLFMVISACSAYSIIVDSYQTSSNCLAIAFCGKQQPHLWQVSGHACKEIPR